MTEIELLIGGVSRPSLNGAQFERLNPISQQPVTRAAAATVDDADAAVAAAANAFAAVNCVLVKLLNAKPFLQERAHGRFDHLKALVLFSANTTDAC